MRPINITRVGNGNSNAAILDYFGQQAVGVQVVVVSGSPNWTVQQTLDDPNNPDITPTWFDHADTANMVAQTVSRQSNYGFVPAAVRVSINSGNGTVRLTLLQARGPGGK